MMDGELFPSMAVHPLAAIFPMLSDDELADLAADIKANGLLHPIVRTVDGRTLVDGRNRLAACRIAEVEPWFDDRIRDDAEARALIVSANLQRRNMTKGQNAMALAMIYPEPAKRGGAKDRGSMFGDQTLVTRERLSLARAVLRYSLELAQQVLAGKSLDEAYREVESAQGKDANRRSRLNKLRAERPDLADAVADELMLLSEAEEKAREDVAAAKKRRWATTCNLVEALDLLDPQPADAVAVTLHDFDPLIAEQKSERLVTPGRLRNAADFLAQLAEEWEEQI